MCVKVMIQRRTPSGSNFFLGDLVGYFRDGLGCFTLLKLGVAEVVCSLGVHFILANMIAIVTILAVTDNNGL